MVAPQGIGGIIVPTIFFLIVIFGIVKAKGGKVSFLVLKKFEMNQNENKLIDIEGRKAGLISWFLNIIGVNPTVSLKVFKDEIVFEEGSLSGEKTWAIPVSSISATQTGYYKPWGLIVLSIIFLLSAIFSTSFVGSGLSIFFIIFAIIFFIIYKFSKSISIIIESKGSKLFGLSFKPSIIENVTVNIEKAKIAMSIVRNVSK